MENQRRNGRTTQPEWRLSNFDADVLLALRKMANMRSAEALALVEYAEELCNLLSDKITEGDVFIGLNNLGKTGRKEGETAWPDWKTVEDAVKIASRDRRIAEMKARSLSDGRLPGEDSVAYSKRIFEEEKALGNHDPDDAMQAKIAALNAKLRMPNVSTQSTSQFTSAHRFSMGDDMRTDSCDAFITLLETLNHDERDAVTRVLTTIQNEHDCEATMKTLKALWDRKGKSARNLLVLVKGEKRA